LLAISLTTDCWNSYSCSREQYTIYPYIRKYVASTRYHSVMTRRKAALLLVCVVLIGLNGALFYVLTHNSKALLVSFLNVGQGDAILVVSPTGEQILIDGGPDRSVLRELPRRIGPLDRSLDLVIATHPDKDHIAGLADVFDRYDIDAFLDPNVANDTSYAQALTYAASTEEGIEMVVARRGMRVHIGGGAYLDVLFPDRDVASIEANTGSIVTRLVYRETSFMLTGDAPSAIEEWLVELDGSSLASDVLKAGHHGSRTSTSEEWMAAVAPRFVVISAGEGNSYGHPHAEVVGRIQESGAQLLSTMDGGVRFQSDGRTVIQK